MTEQTNKEGMVEISLVRLFMAALATNGVLKIDAKHYMGEEINSKRIQIDIDQENMQFVASLVDASEVTEGNKDESRPDGE